MHTQAFALVFGTGCSSDHVQGASPRSRDLVIKKVSKVTKETDLKDHIKSKGVCVRSSSLMLHMNAKHQTFKLEIFKDELMKVYNPDFWQYDINTRRYFPPKGGDKQTDSKQSNGETGVNSSQNETNTMDLKFGSYNCKYVGVDKYVIMQTLLVACDLLLIQEHCMHKTQFVQRLNSFSPSSVCVVSSSMDESMPLIDRPYGAVQSFGH